LCLSREERDGGPVTGTGKSVCTSKASNVSTFFWSDFAAIIAGNLIDNMAIGITRKLQKAIASNQSMAAELYFHSLPRLPAQQGSDAYADVEVVVVVLRQLQHTSAYVSIRQHTPAYVSSCQITGVQVEVVVDV
jgi:hypothetical protein